jgi:hypothetical protein
MRNVRMAKDDDFSNALGTTRSTFDALRELASNLRVLIAAVFCLIGVFVALLGSGAFSNLFAHGRKIAAGNIELIPTNSSRPVRVIQDNRLISPQRFGAVSILVNDRRHDLVAKCIQGLRNSLLWHKQGRRVRECVNERVDCNHSIRSVVRANTQS